MRKKYTRWYINHMETVERSLLLRIIHYWLYSPSVFLYEIGKRHFMSVEVIGDDTAPHIKFNL